jgi:putative ABC transport system permease protein
MTFLDLTSLSFSALLRHKLRSALTLLGIVIGILSVSAITSVVRGIDRYVADLLGSIGSQGFVVTKIGLASGEEAYLEALRRKDIPASAAEVLKAECPSITQAAPFVRAIAEVRAVRRSAEDAIIEGTNGDAQYTSDIGLADGRYFTPYEIQHARQVCIVGADVADKLFTSGDIIGRDIHIRGRRFRVIGVHARTGTVFGFSQDSFARIPFTTFEKIFGSSYSADISIRCRSQADVPQAVQEVRAVMRRLRKLDLKQEDDFGILTSEALMRLWRGISSTIFIVTIGVAAIALLVGGIGIMNIMFVSVKERTNEIGLRKAVGARRRDILLQFLTESSLLCLVGGGVGLGTGLLAGKILSLKTSLPAAAEWWVIGLALLMSIGVGLFFGVYPAVKAASLPPASTLRYEK